MMSFSGVTFLSFVLLLFRLFIKAAALRSIFLRHAGASIATRVSFFFSFFFFFLYVAFAEYFCTIAVFSLNGEYVVRLPLPDDIFLPRDHGLFFLLYPSL